MTKKLREQIFKLPKAELEQLADEINRKLDDGDGLTREEIAELDRRFEEWKKDPKIGIPAEKVITEMRLREKKVRRAAGSRR